jgi:hypothetical protein
LSTIVELLDLPLPGAQGRELSELLAMQRHSWHRRRACDSNTGGPPAPRKRGTFYRAPAVERLTFRRDLNHLESCGSGRSTPKSND